MTVVLKRSWRNAQGRKYPVGQKIKGTRELEQELIDSGYAERYTIKQTKHDSKMRTDFFKP